MGLTSKAVTLLGAGTQGRRLAYMWSKFGRPVYLVDQNNQQLIRARDEIEELRNKTPSSQPQQWGKVILAQPKDLPSAANKSWLLIECVPESLSLKKEVIKDLDAVAPSDTIIASNSSSYTISEILQDLPVKHLDRFVSLHSYWPPETSAVEIMGSGQTNQAYISRLMQETKDHGFQPFQVFRQSTGYIYNRIWAAIKRETLLVVAEGVAAPEEIDAIFKDVLKTPKGPCEQMDVVGLDVVLSIEEHYADIRQGVPEEPRKLLKKMIAQNKLGVKSGSGFYQY